MLLPSIPVVHRKRNANSVTAPRPIIAAVLLFVTAFTFACGGDDVAPLLPNPTEASSTSPARPTTTAAARPASPATPAPAVTSASLEQARQQLTDGRYAEASASFDALAASAAEPALRAEALVSASVAYSQAGFADRALERLREAAALAPKGSQTERRAGYLLGLRLSEGNRPAEAADLLRPLAAAPYADALQPYVIAAYAQASAAAGEVAAAQQEWTRLLALPALPAPLKLSAWRGRTALAESAGDAGARVEALRRVVALGGSPGDRRALALAAKSAGDEATFASELRSIITGSPASALALEAIATLRSAGYEVDPGDEGLVYYRRGDYAKAQQLFLQAVAVQEGKSGTDLAFEYFYLGAAYEDGGRPGDAVAAYDLAAASDPASNWAHRARYWAARVTEAGGARAAASARYAALVQDGPAGEFTSESAFRAGFSLLQAGLPAEALATWDALALPASARLLYWCGRALDELGDPTSARVAYEAAVAAGPLDFYAGEAEARLGRPRPVDVGYQPLGEVPPPNWDALASWLTAQFGPGSFEGASGAAPELVLLGLRDAAEAEVRALAASDPWSLARAMRAASEAGLPDVAATYAMQLRQRAGIRSDQAPRELLRIAYPLSYVASLSSAAAANRVDPLFLAALVRTESFWDASAGSPAGALGLTQVIPVTAEVIAASLGYAAFSPEDLFRASVSLEFGANYIAGQLARFGNPYYALAAYNAGPGAAQRWAASVAGNSMADFVEAVDYAETKSYVVIGMENYAYYLRAWRD